MTGVYRCGCGTKLVFGRLIVWVRHLSGVQCPSEHDCCEDEMGAGYMG